MTLVIPTALKTHTVKLGETLWQIAQNTARFIFAKYDRETGIHVSRQCPSSFFQ
ncbi:hypothetical protein ACF5W4_04375 [Bacillota bacterium Lsc_1132]